MTRRFPARWVLLVGTAAAAGLAFDVAAQTYLSMLDHGHSFARMVAWQFFCWVAWALVAPFVLRKGAALAMSPMRRQIPGIIAFGLALMAAQVLVATASMMVWQPFSPAEIHSPTTALLTAGLMWSVADVLVYVLLVLLGYASAVYDRAQLAEVRESRLETDLARAQLDALRLEIEPHFLFNTLNGIASLIRARSTDRALAMLLGLSDLLRATVDASHEQSTTLGDEVAFTERYIELQRVRFGDRLTVTVSVPPDCETQMVPRFLLQPIIENAFRHGIAKKSGPCTLELSASREGGWLHLWVRNDGAALPRGFRLEDAAGIGLRNTRERMQRLYGETATLDIATDDARRTAVHIVIPARRAESIPARAIG